MRTPRPVRIVNPPTNENVWDEVDNSWISKIHAWRIALDRRLCNAVEREARLRLKLTLGDLSIMRMKSLVTLMVLSTLAIAQDKITPLDVKMGLWESTHQNNVSGVTLPADMMARLTPEQRAKMEAMIASRQGEGPKTTVSKSCVTREKLDKEYTFSEDREECTRTVLNSTPTKLEVKLVCADKDRKMKSEGTFHLDVVNSELVKGTIHMTMSGESSMKMDNSFTARYLGASCGDVK